ncbi:CPBP family intramembrane glutamic endopeptidase [Acidocella sp.]|uniref:CPBP family intramembrane glutamic endopeptidase n=1 Tax=Acidocella sp. TaxID=50710 RepID=UPI002615EE2C|nr:CPBP family intramembrane glutamic endopeptidase [Acidocella sp.]
MSWLNRPAAPPTIWRGAGGVRSGWRALLFGGALLAFLFGVALELARLAGPWLRASLAAGQVGPGFVVANELMLLVPVVGATLLMARLEGVSPLAFGLAGGRRARHLAWGGLSALVALGALLLGLVALGEGRFTYGGLAPPSALGYALMWGLACALTGLAEELCFRGYLLGVLGRGLGAWPAALITALLFALAHGLNRGESRIGFAMLLAAGLLLVVSRWRTGALWWAIGFHAAWDWGENFLFGTPDSGQLCAGALWHFSAFGPVWLTGGLTGPEGSVLALPVLGAAAAMVFWVCPAQGRRKPRVNQMIDLDQSP